MAQLVERVTVNHKVRGSIPRPTVPYLFSVLIKSENIKDPL